MKREAMTTATEQRTLQSKKSIQSTVYIFYSVCDGFLSIAEAEYCPYTVLFGVNNPASSVPLRQTHASHILVCSPGTAGLPGCWQDCLGSARPRETTVGENEHVNLEHKDTFIN